MKSVIVFYFPIPYTESSTQEKRRKEILNNNYKNLNTSKLVEDFDFVFIEDPDRDKIETEIFFRPE